MKNKSFFDTIKALLPKSRAFNLTHETNQRKFFEVIGDFADDIRSDIEGTYLDYFPETTRALSEWEDTWRVKFSTNLFSESERRTVLKILWWIRYGNVTADFMQKALEQIIDGVKVTDNTPVTNIIGLIQSYRNVNGNKYMICGGERAVCAEGNIARTYKAVNGNQYMVCNNKHACCGFVDMSGAKIPSVLRNDSIKAWDIPEDERYQAMCFFISGEVAKDDDGNIISVQWLTVEEKWQKFIEYLVLALKPVHTTAILFIEYTDNDSSETIHIVSTHEEQPNVVYDEDTETLKFYNIDMDIIE